jgi:WD40 repeat protein
LSAFREEDKDLFFGREEFVHQLVDAVKKHPLVPVIGASGSGKSSVVLAGLIPRLRAERNWLIESFRPQSQPFYELASALVLACYPELKKEERKDDRKERVTKLFDQFEGNRKLWQEVRDILKEHPGKRLLLVVDQFEELYVLDNKQEFVNALLEAIKLNPRFKLVLTIRTDFLDYIINDPPFKDVALKPDTPQYLGAMNDEKDIKSVIELTDHRRTEKIVTLEDGLTDIIWKDVKQEPGNLPLLEFALTQLWEKNGGGILTHQTYIKIGGVKKALANHADEIYKNLDDQAKKQFKQIFVQLARPGEFLQPASPGEKVDVAEEEKRRGQQSFVTPDTRRLATRAEIGEDNWRLVQKFAGKDPDIPDQEKKKLPLLVTGRNENTGEQTVEVVHEALIREWTLLRKWIDDDRTFLTWQEQLRANMNQWNISKQDDGALLRGFLLSEAQKQFQERITYLTSKEQEYIKKSSKKHRLEQIKKQINVTGVVVFVLGIIGTIAVSSLAQKNIKLEQVGSSALIQFDYSELESLVSAMNAGQELQQLVGYNLPLKQFIATSPLLALQKITDNIHEKNQLIFDKDNQYSGNDKKINSVIFNPKISNVQSIATAGKDGMVRLWNLSGQETHKIPAHDGSVNGVNSISFSNDGQKIASSGEDGKTKIWDLSGNLITELPKEKEGGIKSVSFSPDGKKIAISGDYGIASIWDLSTKKSVQLKGHTDKINSITFSADGNRIATAGKDGTVRFWNLSGKQLSQITPHKGQPVVHVSFSPNGQLLATAGEDNVARIWNLSGQEKKKLEGHQGWVIFVNFSPDGKRLVTTSNDSTVRVWDISGKEIYKFQGHESAVLSASFSSDGKYLASAGNDGKTRIWNLSNRQITQAIKFNGHQDDVNSLSISPDGKLMASGDNDGIVRFWDLSSKKQIGKELKADNTGRIYSVKFSPDGKSLVTGGQEGIAKIWDLSTRKQINQFKGNYSFVSSLSFSLDGKYIATIRGNKQAKIWRPDQEKVISLEGHQSGAYRISFNPKKQIIATGGLDGTVGLWNFDGNKANKISIWPGHQVNITSLSFSQDGNLFATGDGSSVVKIWDLSVNKQLEFFSYQSGVRGLSFSPDGQYLATGGIDGTVRVWDLQGRQISEFKIEQGSVWDVSFSPDGKSIIAGGEKGSLQLWKFKQLDELLVEGCDWLKGYLENSGQTKDRLEVCPNRDSNHK